MVLYYNNVREKANNTKYPFEKEIHTLEDFKKVVCYDHVGAKYQDYYRKNENFIQTNCTMFDVDNTETDDQKEWKTPADIQKAFPDVPFYVSYSRNHMKIKGDKLARPKFHIYFPDIVISDSEVYKNLKDKVCAYFPAFDDNAKDAARFFFGVENPQVEYHEGKILLSDFMKTVQICTTVDTPVFSTITKDNIIPQGTRNNTMFKFACKVLRQINDIEEAAQEYKHEAEKCSPPLEEKELNGIWKSALKYYHKDIKGLQGHISQSRTLKPHDFTDVGQAEILIREYGDRLRYSPATRYLYYTGKVWKESDIKAQGLAQELTDRQLKEATSLLQDAYKKENEAAINEDEEEKKEAKTLIRKALKYRDFVLHYRHSLRISAALKEAQPKVEIDITKLDADGLKLNTPAGYVDLKNGQMYPHKPTVYCTKITSVGPDRRGEDLFRNFLKVITCQNSELEEYLQLVAGMCAVGKVFCENLIIAYGSGKNGKSTFFNLLARVMGDYAGSLSTETLITHSRKNKSPEYAELRGKRIVIASELEEETRLDTATVKKLCSTDPIYAEKKYKDPFQFTPSHTIILHTNHLPNVKTMDHGTWRRLIVVPFMAVIEDNADIKNYCEYLFEHAGGAVLTWIIEGARKFIAQQYKIELPKIVKNAINTYRQENNLIGNFILDECDIDKTFVQPAGELYSRFREYCGTLGEHQIPSAGNFKSQMIEAGYSWDRNNKGAFYYGVCLKKEASISTEMNPFPYVISRFDEKIPSTMMEGDSDFGNYSEEEVEF